jgi:hypothetical protein
MALNSKKSGGRLLGLGLMGVVLHSPTVWAEQTSDLYRLDANIAASLYGGNDDDLWSQGDDTPLLLSQSEVQDTQQPVGQAPTEDQVKQREDEAAAQAAISDVAPGVLTKKGRLIVEPGIQWQNSTANTFNVLGVQIIPGFFVGLFQTERADRDLLEGSLTLRYGLTHRMDADVKVPYIYRDDDTTQTIRDPNLPPNSFNQSLTGDGLGDVEAALHYQFNSGQGGWPFFVGNVRVKTPTGTGPFDVDFNSTGNATELPTGSGSWGIEPSLTILYPTDPAVLFANFGYFFHLKDDVNRTFGSGANAAFVGTVDPGDAFRLSFGMAYAVNERTTMTLGYKQDFVGESTVQINGLNQTSPNVKIGSLLVGFGIQATKRAFVNLDLEVGVTTDAPDIVLKLRAPISIN